MRLVCIGEGETEFVCVPTIAGNLGHTIISSINMGGLPTQADWDAVFRDIVLPYVRTAALRNPDKILVVVDREKRANCCPALAIEAVQVLQAGLQAENLQGEISVVVCDRKFESLVMADFDAVDALPILSRPVSPDFGGTLDGKSPLSLVKAALRPGAKYDKVRHGSMLAAGLRMDNPALFARSRSLRKLVKELPSPIYF